MREDYEPRFELHQILNTVLAALLLSTVAFLWSVNNQLIITNEKIQVISKTLDTLENRVSKSEEKVIDLKQKIR